MSSTDSCYRLETLKRTASVGHAWLLLLLLRGVIIIRIMATWSSTSGISEQRPRTNWFVAVTDAFEAIRHRSSYTLNLLASFHLRFTNIPPLG